MREMIFTRDIAGKINSFDDETASVQVVAVTENPVWVWDAERQTYMEEILLVDGCTLPPSGQAPLLDAHNRISVSSVLGSARNFRAVDNRLESTVVFSGTAAGKDTAQKVKEGHLTDFSVGYTPIESYYIPDGQTESVNGREFTGPVKVTSKWHLKELSITPIGADNHATVRVSQKPAPATAAPAVEEPLPPPDPTPAEGERAAAEGAPAAAPAPPKKSMSLMDMVFYGLLILMAFFLLYGLFE